jgi:hypothetical protein
MLSFRIITDCQEKMQIGRSRPTNVMNTSQPSTPGTRPPGSNSKQHCIKYLAIGLVLVVVAAIPGKAVAERGTVPPQKQGVVSTIPAHEKTVAQGKVNAAYGQLPLAFETNEGQSDPRVKFLCRGAGYGLFLTGSDTVLALTRAVPKDKAAVGKGIKGTIGMSTKHTFTDVLRFKLLGAKARTQVTGLQPLPGNSNYFIGNDPKKWRTNVPQYAKVKSGQVYPGIDMVYYGRQGQLEYDFQIAPGADPKDIQFTVEGARKASLNASGDLVLQTPGGDVIEHAPIIYQEVDGKRKTIRGSYEVRRLARTNSKTEETFEVSFRMASYDRGRPVVIDPSLTYSTYFGGSGSDYATGIAVDASGNVYITGRTSSPDFPITPGAAQASLGGTNGNVFVTELNLQLSGSASLVYSIYLGGSGGDQGNGIAVDGSCCVYVTGRTNSTNFPVTAGAYEGSLHGMYGSAFVTKLDPNLSGSASLVYSTYLGGSGGGDQGNGIAVDGSGNAYVTGLTDSTNFPVTAGAYKDSLGETWMNVNAFVTKLNPNLSGSASLVYSTYLGGSGGGLIGDQGNGIAVDGSGNAYVTGWTTSWNFPITPGAYQVSLGGTYGNAFVTKLDPNLSGSSSLVYSTYLGGSGNLFLEGDQGNGIAVDGSGNAYVTGWTTSWNFPTSPGAYQTFRGKLFGNAFVAELNPNISGSGSLVYSTYLGGYGSIPFSSDVGNGVAVDGSGNAYITGQTSSPNFPTTADAFHTSPGGSGAANAFVTELNPSLSGSAALLYSTYLGGSGSADGGDSGNGIALDGSGNVYVVGCAASADFPTTPAAFETTLGSLGTNAFVTRFNALSYAPPLTYMVTPTAEANGRIGPNTPGAVSRGANVDFVATPDSGYDVGVWILNGSVVQFGGATYTLNDVNADSTVEVTFTPAPGSHTVIPKVGVNGGISPNTNQIVASGGSVTFNASPDYGYIVSQWVFNGRAVQTGGMNYTLSNVTANGTVEVTFRADSSTPPGPGKYTILLRSPDVSGTVPQGTGYGTITINNGSDMLMAGKLPDGEGFRISEGAIIITGTGVCLVPLNSYLKYPFVTTRGAKGSLVNNLEFETDVGMSDLNATLGWVKPLQSKETYRSAFNTTLDVIGSLYIPPKEGSSVLPGFTTGTLVLSDTTGVVLTGTCRLSAANKLITTNPPDKLTVTINPSTGVFKGTFMYPGKTPKPTDFAGVLFQDQTNGGGFFLGPNGSGTVNLIQSPP